MTTPRTRHDVPATQVAVGDRTSRNGKTRVARVHVHNGRLLAQVRTTGTRSPSLVAWPLDATVTVWR